MTDTLLAKRRTVLLLKAVGACCVVAAGAAPWLAMTSIDPPADHVCGLWAFLPFSLRFFSTLMLLLTAFACKGTADRVLKPGRVRRRDRLPEKLRFLASSWAADGNISEALRWQSEAVRLAATDRRAEYRAELDRYEARTIPPQALPS